MVRQRVFFSLKQNRIGDLIGMMTDLLGCEFQRAHRWSHEVGGIVTFRAALGNFRIHFERANYQCAQNIAGSGVQVDVAVDEHGIAFTFGLVVGGRNADMEKIEQAVGIHAWP